MHVKKLLLNLLLVSLFLLSATLSFSASASLVFRNSTSPLMLEYDRLNSTIGNFTYGSDSYMDDTITNRNLFLSVCHPDLSSGKFLDLVYYTESGNITKSILGVPVQVESTYTNGDDECAVVDVDISSQKAIYPGFVLPAIYTNLDNITSGYYLMDELNEELNGTFDIAVRVDAPPKVYYFSTYLIKDNLEQEISRSAEYLLTTFINSSDDIISEYSLEPNEAFIFEGSMKGREKVFVNGILSLEIRLFNPCGMINESGYYILNQSSFETNESCVFINNTNNVVLNFVGEIIDGDNLSNGSLAHGVCPVLVNNSVNISFESLHTQQFMYGLCVYNSSVDIIGTNSVYNSVGAYINNNSRVKFVDVRFDHNTQTDIAAVNDSRVRLVNVNFTSARIYSTFQNAYVRAVLDPPSPPNLTDVKDIGQYIEFWRSSATKSWAEIDFRYTIPLPEGVVVDNMSIFKYNGTLRRQNQTRWNETSNSSYQVEITNWTGGVWTKLYTLISPSEMLIMGPNVTQFSVFAPFAYETTQTEPEPEPEPEPDPDPEPEPEAGPGGGGGGTPSGPEEDVLVPIFPEPVILNLSLPENVTIMQGEAKEIFFNLTNRGLVAARNITIIPEPRKGWDRTNYTLDELLPADNVTGSFLIAPYEKATSGIYIIPVSILVTDPLTNKTYEIIRDFFRVIVVPRGNLSRIRVTEYPPVVEMPPYSALNISFLAENIGDVDLYNITIDYYSNKCLINITGSNDIKQGEIKLLSYQILSADEGECTTNLKFMSNGALVGFAPVTFTVQKPVSLLGDFRFYLLLLVLTGWTVLTFIVLRRTKKEKGQKEAKKPKNPKAKQKG